MNWIDAHVHVWTAPSPRYPEPGPRPAYMTRPRYEPADFLAEAGPEGVGRAVLIQTDCYGHDHAYLRDVLAAQPERFRGVAVVDPAAADAAELLERLRPQGFAGLRVVGLEGTPTHWLEAPTWTALFHAAARHRLVIGALVGPPALPVVEALCRRHPDLVVVVDHLARIGLGGTVRPEEVEALCRLARCPRVCVKLSAFYALGRAQPPYLDLLPLIERLLEAFGPQRLMWASDCPFQTDQAPYGQALALLRDHLPALSQAERDSLLHHTAHRVYFEG